MWRPPSLPVLLLLAGAWTLTAADARSPAYFPIEEVRPGLVGEGVTVFEGTRRESFAVHVLGVLRNVVGPQRHLIVARLEGGPLAHTGVIAGMSGSPVSIDGRLVGAIAYSLGAFAKEPIAGITPIAEMVAEGDRAGSRPRPAGTPPVRLPVDEAWVVDDLRRATGQRHRFASSRTEVQRLRGEGLDVALALRPIATPIALGGFSREVADRLGELAADLGLRAVSGGVTATNGAAVESSDPLTGGDALGITLVGGDLTLTATGTVTLVDGPRVYAFGHPLVNLGPVRMPMTRAHVHTVVPSLLDSFKIASPGAVIGTLDQDRATAVAGTLGPPPRTIPLRLSLVGAGTTPRRFAFDIVDDPVLTPTLAFFSMLSVLQNFERVVGPATVSVRGQVRVRGHGAFDFEELFAGDNISSAAAGYLVTPLALLARSALQAVDIEGIDVTLTAAETPRIHTIDRAWLDSPRVRAGETVPLRVALRPWRAPETIRTVPVAIPPAARGPLTLVVGDATRIAPYDTRDLRQAPNADNVPALLRAFSSLRRNHVLYVRLVAADTGFVVGGEPLTGLPPSVAGVLDAQRASIGATPVRQATVGAWDVPTDAVVSGLRTVTVTVEQD